MNGFGWPNLGENTIKYRAKHYPNDWISTILHCYRSFSSIETV